MNYYLIKNLVQEDGQCDYKGLDTNLINKGTQKYPSNLSENNYCVLQSQEDLKDNADFKKINQDEYLNYKLQIEKTFEREKETEVERLLKEKQELENQLLIEKDKNIGGIL